MGSNWDYFNNNYVIIRHDTDAMAPKIMGPMDGRKAERVADGAGVNLDWENWHIDIVDTPEEIAEIQAVAARFEAVAGEAAR